MATVAPVRQAVSQTGDYETFLWENLATGDTVTALALGNRPIALDWQVTGTFGGATIGLTGSNDGTTFADMTEGDANAIALTAARMISTRELPLHLKPSISGGSSDAVDVVLKVTYSRRGGI